MVIRTRSAVRGGPYYPNLTSDAQNKRFGCFFLSHSAKIIRVMWILLSEEKKKRRGKKKEIAPNNTSKHLERRLLWTVVVASQLLPGCALQKEMGCVPSERDARVL